MGADGVEGRQDGLDAGCCFKSFQRGVSSTLLLCWPEIRCVSFSGMPWQRRYRVVIRTSSAIGIGEFFIDAPYKHRNSIWTSDAS